MPKLTTPVAYQGGKQRLASKIIDIINPDGRIFYDLCCGSGAISIELLNRGHERTKIHMLDSSPWGMVWKHIGDGTFDIDRFEQLCREVPEDRTKIQGHIKELSRQPASIDTPYVFLLLQATSFGGKSIWIKDNKWMNCSFRSYWLPTATSNRRSPVLAMHPEPPAMIERMKFVVENMKGINGYCCDITSLSIEDNSIVYVDPPYRNTTSYGYDFDVVEYVKKIGKKCYVSEGVALSSESYLLNAKMAKGGISGERKKFHEEWLSIL
jgi:site-specific DNA-adenine methylase